MTEEFVFDQCFGNGRAVDRDKWFIAAVGQVMDGTREQLFSGSRFAEQQNSGFRLGNALCFTYGPLDHVRLANDSWKAVAT